MDAKIQHLPELRWFVTGDPSKGILILKVCVSFRMVEGFWRMVAGLLVDRAEKARRFFGSWSVLETHEVVFEMETAVLRSGEY